MVYPRTETGQKHAVVIGGSIAGLCAARVLSEHYDRVTILDSDTLPLDPSHRVGVPQGHHGHGLMARGQMELNRLFPNFEDDLVARGALRIHISRDFAIRRQWGWAPRITGLLHTLWCSRPVLEATIRARVAAITSVKLRDQITVTNLRFAPGSGIRVIGVEAESSHSVSEFIPANLIVDASGRGTKYKRWFTEAGLPLPPDEFVESFTGYASRFYRMPPDSERPPEWWWKGLWIEPTYPDLPRGGALLPVEDNCWLVTAYGLSKDYAPGEEVSWLEFLSGLSSPIIARAVSFATPVSEIATSRSTTNRFVRYEKWTADVPGFIAIGDSVCAFNPIYGQGMASALACAHILEDTLKRVGANEEGLEKEFFRMQGEFLQCPWTLSTRADLMWPATAGKRTRTPYGLLRSLYLSWSIEAMHFDPKMLVKIGRVVHLVDGMAILFAPRTIIEIIRSTVRRRLTAGWQNLTRTSSTNTPPMFPPEATRS